MPTTRRNFITGALGALSAMFLGRAQAIEVPGEVRYFVGATKPPVPSANADKLIPHRWKYRYCDEISYFSSDVDVTPHLDPMCHISPGVPLSWEPQPLIEAHMAAREFAAGTLDYALTEYLAYRMIWGTKSVGFCGAEEGTLDLYASSFVRNPEGKVVATAVEIVLDDHGPTESRLARNVNWDAAMAVCGDKARRIAEENLSVRERWTNPGYWTKQAHAKTLKEAGALPA